MFGLFKEQKMELSEFIPKFLQTIVTSNVFHDLPKDKFSDDEVKRIHDEIKLLRYVLFYFFVLDSAREGYIQGLSPEQHPIVDKILDASLKKVFSEAGYSSQDAILQAEHLKESLSDYKKKVREKTEQEYRDKGYLFVVAYCLARCGYQMPPERKSDVDPVSKNEGVFDLINQVYLKMKEAFARTVRNYPVYFGN